MSSPVLAETHLEPAERIPADVTSWDWGVGGKGVSRRAPRVAERVSGLRASDNTHVHLHALEHASCQPSRVG